MSNENEAKNKMGRSVTDFGSAQELRQALRFNATPPVINPQSPSSSSGQHMIAVPDWMLPVFDDEAGPQNADHEVQRLLVVQTFLPTIEHEHNHQPSGGAAAFLPALTRQVCADLNVASACITLVDLGRVIVLANSDDVALLSNAILPRHNSLCPHTILNKSGRVMVPNIWRDARFHGHPALQELGTSSELLPFYASVPLISPEGYKVGALCVKAAAAGPKTTSTSPTRESLTVVEWQVLQHYAQQAMSVLVQQRRRISDSDALNDSLICHAAVCTNLGVLLYKQDQDIMLAMRLYQESVQTLMYVQNEGSALAPLERRTEMADGLQSMRASCGYENISSRPLRDDGAKATGDGDGDASKSAIPVHLLDKIYAQFPDMARTKVQDAALSIPRLNHATLKGHEERLQQDGIPGLFGTISRLRGAATARDSLPSLMFAEAFEVSLEVGDRNASKRWPIELRQFMIPIDHGSKATMFNMGLIHYHWGNQDTALKLFDLAASSSQQLTPLAFDPVLLGCLNNTAQLHLQKGRPMEAMELLLDALTRGNAALVAMYDDVHHVTRTPVPPTTTKFESEGFAPRNADGPISLKRSASLHAIEQSAWQYDVHRSHRLRRKLARTIMNMAHVQFFQADYAAATESCRDALRLLHTNMDTPEVAGVWYNLGVIAQHRKQRIEALGYLDKYLARAKDLLGANHLQVADGLHRKGIILFEMGNLYDSMTPLNDALRVRLINVGDTHPLVAESLFSLGKVLQEREEYDFAIIALSRGVEVHKQLAEKGSLSFDAIQAMLDIGRALQTEGHYDASLATYREVLEQTRSFFGERHPYVARLLTILGNLHLEQGNVDEALSSFREGNRIQHRMDIARDRLCRVTLERHPCAGTA